MKNLYLLRHGHTIWTERGRVAGRSDIPLSAVGEAAVKSLARSFKPGCSYTHWFCSPLQRTQQTSALIRTELSTICSEPLPEIQTDSRLVELDFGDWEGMTWDQIHRKYRSEMQYWGENWVNHSPPNGERFDEQAQRCELWLSEWREQTASERGSSTMVVAHGGTIRAIVCLCLTWPLPKAMSFSVNPASLCWLQQKSPDSPWCARMINSQCF